MTLSAGGIRRRRVRFVLDRAIRAVELPAGADALARAVPTEANGVDLELRRAWATVDGVEQPGDGGRRARGHDPAGRAAEGQARGEAARRRGRAAGAAHRRRAAGASARGSRSRSSARRARRPTTRPVPTATRACCGSSPRRSAAAGGRPVLVPDRLAGGMGRRDGTELALTRTRQGDAALVERTPRAVVGRPRGTGRARWCSRARCPLDGEAAFVLRLRDGVEEHAVPVRGEGGRFSATLTPAAIASMAGTLPLREGTWRLFLRADGRPEAPVMVAPALVAARPARAHRRAQGLHVLPDRPGRRGDPRRARPRRRRAGPVPPAAAARRRRRPPARGRCATPSSTPASAGASTRTTRARSTRSSCGAASRSSTCGWCATAPARSRGRRGAAQEQPRVPRGARHRALHGDQRVMPSGSPRDGQVVVQTLHGHPIAPPGFDVAAQRGKARRLLKGLTSRSRAGRTCSPPAGARRSSCAARSGSRAGCWRRACRAPTCSRARGARRGARRCGPRWDCRTARRSPLRADLPRDAVDRRGRFRLDLHADLGRLRDAAGPDAVVLFRKHPFISDASPQTGERILDVSIYPDGTELLPAADVLITDYSSMLVDFAPTGLPLLCFGYDLEEYADGGARLLRAVRGDGARRRCCGPRTSSPRRSPIRRPRARRTPGAARRSWRASARSTTAARRRASRTRCSPRLLARGGPLRPHREDGRHGDQARAAPDLPRGDRDGAGQGDPAQGAHVQARGRAARRQGDLLRARPALALRERLPQPPAQGAAEVLLRVVAGGGRGVRALPDAAGARRGAGQRRRGDARGGRGRR